MTDSPDDRLKELYAAGIAGAPPSSHATPEALAAAVEREGPEAERLRTLDHVAQCASCRRDFELLRAARAAGHQLGERSRRTWGFGLAAAAAVLIAVTFSVSRVTAPSRPAIPLERGAVPAGGAHAIELIEPTGGSSTGAAPLLRWHAVAGRATYHLQVLDSTGAVVSSRETPDTLSTASGLLPGRAYRWWVRAIVNGQEWRSAFGTFSMRR